MSPVLTESDVAVLMSQKTPSGATLYLYPVVRDVDVLLTSEDAEFETLDEMLAAGVKPSFASLQAIFQSSDDIVFEYDETSNTIKGTHKNLLSAGSARGTDGSVEYGGEIRIPTFSFDANGHITGTSVTVVTLPAGYTLPKASSTTLGGIMIGSGLSVDSNGKVSVNTASGTVAGIVKLNSATNSSSTTEAATPKAVSDALKSATDLINEKVEEMNTNGVKPNYDELMSMFISSSDLSLVTDEENGTVSFAHANSATAGEIVGSSGSVNAGGSISIPAITIDGHGHVTGSRLVSVTLPDAYVLPTASATTKGGMMVGDGLSVDATGKVSVKEGSKTQAGIVQLESSTSSSAEDVAATPKAVSDAKKEAIAAANEAIEQAKEDMNADGVNASYESVSGMFESSSDISATKNANSKVVSFTHKNSIEAGGVNTGGSTLENGGSFLVPTFNYDEHGHITEAGQETVTINPMTGEQGVEVEGGIIRHTNKVTAGSTKDNTAGTVEFGGKFYIPRVVYDANGHITSVSYKELALPANPDTNTTYGLEVGSTTESVADGSSYDTVTETTPVKLAGSDNTEVGGNVVTKYLRYNDFNGTNAGLVPAAGSANAGKFLKGDGTWATPTDTKYTHPSYTAQSSGLYKITVDETGHVSAVSVVAKSDITALGIPANDTTYSVFTKATSSAAGSTGLVPAPAAGKQNAFLRGDGTWATPENTVYTHPSHTAYASGLYKVTVNNLGHVTAATAVAKSDITALGIPGSDTTYSAFSGASSSAAGSTGLVPAPAKGDQAKFLRADGTWVVPTDTKYTHPNSGVSAGTYRSVTVDSNGHVTAGSNPTTLAGYGITDASSKKHTHQSADIISLDGSKITGTIPISAVPKAALERLVPVTDATAMYKLTTDDIQLGDTVQLESTGVMYLVIDTANLGNENGYKPYTAGAAASVPWSGVTGKPSTFTPATHTHPYAGSSTAGGAATKAISDNDGQKITSTYIKNITISGKTVTITRGDDTTFTATTQDTNTTYSVFTKATASASGSTGLVPAPAAGQQGYFLRGDGTWAAPENTVYSHPTHTAYASGLYKVTVNNLGHVTTATAVAKSDITALGIPGSDTTYSAFGGASSSAAGSTGLVPAPAKGDQAKFLRADGTWVVPTNTTYSAATSSALGLVKIGSNISNTDGTISLTKANVTAALGYTPPTTNTTYSVFSAATSSAAGSTGLVPAPAAGKQNAFLRGDGTWATPTNTTYSAATSSALGLVKIGSNISNTDGTISLTKANVTAALGYTPPTTNTTYSVFGAATADAAGSTGLVPAPAKGDQAKFLRADGTWVVPTDTKYTHPSYTAKSSGLYKITVDATGHVSAVTAVAKSDITALGIPGSNTTYSAATSSALGLVKIGSNISNSSGTISLTKDNVTAALGYTPPTTNTTYSVFSAATSSAAGSTGLVPAPAKGDQAKFLRADGTWVVPTDTKYTHPSYTAQSSGLYKITVDAKGHVSAVTAVAKSDITALGIPGSNTTYSAFGAATSSAAGTTGLVPAPAAGKQSSFLRGDGTWATPTDTKYIHPSYTAKSSGLYKITVDATGHVSAVTAVAKSDITALGIPGSNTTYSAATSSALGLVKIGSNISNTDGTISLTKANVTAALGYTPPTTNTTYSAFGAATADAAGSTGLVPAPAAGKQSSFLRGDGTWATPTNTKNTAGSTDSSSKLFLIGATSQAANPQTYSHDTVYVGTDGHLYSNSVQVVNLSGSQALTNKTYNGFTLAAACARGVVTAPTSGSNALITGGGVYTMASTMDTNVVISETQPSNPTVGYTMWYKVLSTES